MGQKDDDFLFWSTPEPMVTFLGLKNHTSGGFFETHYILIIGIVCVWYCYKDWGQDDCNISNVIIIILFKPSLSND